MLLETWLLFVGFTLVLLFWRLKKKSRVLDLFFSIWLIVFGVVTLVGTVEKTDYSYKVIEQLGNNKTIEYYPYTIDFKQEQPFLYKAMSFIIFGLGLILAGKELWGGGE